MFGKLTFEPGTTALCSRMSLFPEQQWKVFDLLIDHPQSSLVGYRRMLMNEFVGSGVTAENYGQRW